MKSFYLKSLFSFLSSSLLSVSAFAGGGSRTWTYCNVKDLGLSYSFNRWISSLQVGDKLTVLPADGLYGLYKVEFIDLSLDIGVVELSHSLNPDYPADKNIDFGKMKIEYLSNSALKDIQVTFTKDGVEKVGSNVSCIAD